MSPAYDYKCPVCGETVEKNHGIFEEPEVVCSRCGQIMAKIPSLCTYKFIDGFSTRHV